MGVESLASRKYSDTVFSRRKLKFRLHYVNHGEWHVPEGLTRFYEITPVVTLERRIERLKGTSQRHFIFCIEMGMLVLINVDCWVILILDPCEFSGVWGHRSLRSSKAFEYYRGKKAVRGLT